MRDTDTRHRFLIESCDVRGQLVQLDQSWIAACARTAYPPVIRQLLGEAFVATALLAGMVKFKGKLTLQVRGTGPVHLLVVQVTAGGDIRGLARWRNVPATAGLAAALGSGATMTISIETAREGLPYQGIVALEGETLADALSSYFRNSEQLDTRLLLSVSRPTAAGLLLQKLPGTTGAAGNPDGWQRALVLANTVQGHELRELDATALLGRLYHEEVVRLYAAQPLRFACSCSRSRTDAMLLGLGKDEVRSIVREEQTVEITCEFCDAQYRYDAIDVEALFRGLSPVNGSPDSAH